MVINEIKCIQIQAYEEKTNKNTSKKTTESGKRLKKL